MVTFPYRFATFCLALLLSVSVQAGMLDDEYQSAVSSYDKGELRKAVIQLKNILQKEKNHYKSRQLLGEIYFKLQDLNSAEKELGFLRDSGAERSSWIVLLGKVYLMNRSPEKMLSAITVENDDSEALANQIHSLRVRAMLKKNAPRDARIELESITDWNDREALVARIQLNIAEKNIVAADKFINEALDLYPGDTDLLLLKAELQSRNSEYARAVEIYTDILSREPYLYRVQIARAMLYLRLKDAENARADIITLNKKHNKVPEVLYLNALIALHDNNQELAKESLLKLLRLVPNHMPSQYMLGFIYYSQGQYESAETYLSAYVENVNNDAKAAKLLAATYLKSGKPDEVIKFLTSYRIDKQDDAQLLSILGTAYLKNKKYEKGLELLEKAAALSPDASSIQTQLALGNLASGDSREAIARLEEGVRLDQDSLETQMLLILVYVRERRFDDAMASVQGLVKKFPDSPVVHNLLGMVYMSQGKIDDSRRALNKALEIDPEFSVAWINLARSYDREANYDMEMDCYNKILAYDNSHLAALLGLANVWEKKNEVLQSLKWVEQAKSSNPEAVEPGLILSRYYLQQGEFLKALNEARRIYDLAPHRADVIKALGDAQIAGNKYSSAITTYKKLVDALPGNAEAHYLLARAYMANKSSKLAYKSLGETLSINSAYLPALVSMVGLELESGDIDKALALARKVQKQYPGTGVGYELEGRVHEKNNDTVKALSSYKEGYRLSPSRGLAYSLYNLYEKSAEHENARDIVLDWLSHMPEDTRSLMLLASIYQNDGDRDNAIQTYERVRLTEPDNVIVLNNLAWMYLELKDKRSIEYAQKAYELAGKRPEIADTYGWVLLNMGDAAKGLDVLQSASVNAPHIPSIRYHLAVGLYSNGRHDDARKELEWLLRMNKDFDELNDAKLLLKKLN